MDFRKLTAGQNDSNRRLDKILRLYIPQIPLSQIYKLLRKGLIKVNGKKASPELKICQGDELEIAEFIFEKKDTKENNLTTSIPSELPALPEIVFQNQHVLILNKPYDMLVHGSSSSLDKIVVDYYIKSIGLDSLAFTPGPLHRLDKKTCGLIAFSLSIKGSHWYSENIKSHSITKKYLGLVEGKVDSVQKWQDFIKKENTSGKKFHTVKASNQKKDDEKECITIVTPLKSGKFNNIPVSLVEFNIKTGRTHQIRAQSALHKHPLLGDTAYGGTKLKDSSKDFFLTAYSLDFPKDNPLNLPENIKIIPDILFQKMLKSCGIEFLVL